MKIFRNAQLLMKVFDFSNPDLYFLIVLSILNAVALCFLSRKFLQIIQISNYNIRLYGRWVKDTKAKWVSRISLLSLLSFVSVFVTSVLFSQFVENKLFGYLGLFFYFAFIVIFVLELKKIPQKKPLKFTKRMIRIYAVLFVLYLGITFTLLMFSLSYSNHMRVSVISLVPIVIPIIVPFATIINYPIEKLIAAIYKSKCKKKLKKQKELIKIGITGSYGKTTTKMFLYQFLKDDFKVCATPSSYNTPMGICKVVLNELKSDDQIFIAEMGANKVGDINELCDMVGVDAGIITAVGPQHLETFKTLENVIKTKSELYESLKEDSVCVFNLASENTNKMFNQCKLKNKIAIGKKDSFMFAKNIVAKSSGLEFCIVYNKKEYNTQTKILGEHNIQNILLAASMALKLGVSIEKILDIIPKLQPVEHRLEFKQLENNIVIIDDSFNSNIQGTAVALNTLKLFENNRKIVVTPGLIELGKNENLENVEYGKRIADVCDIAILVGKTQSENLKKGLVERNFKEENIIVKDTLFEVTELFKTLLQSGDVVLLENDLPDNYK